VLDAAQCLVGADHVGAGLDHRRAAFGGVHQGFVADVHADIGLSSAGGDAGGEFGASGDGGIDRGFGSGQLGSDVVGGETGLGHWRNKGLDGRGLNGHRQNPSEHGPWGRVVDILSDDHRPKELQKRFQRGERSQDGPEGHGGTNSDPENPANARTDAKGILFAPG